jgi:hypothetical protein
MNQFALISDLTTRNTLESLAGPISGIHKTLFNGIGFSGSSFEKIEVDMVGAKKSYILKQTNLTTDWLSLRTDDRVGREAALLAESRLRNIWDSFHCPYVAYATEKVRIALLMNDLSAHLFPDVREPIDIKAEDAILNALASLHASFWESREIKEIDWLGRPAQYLDVLRPGKRPTDLIAIPPPELFANITRGWEIAGELLSADIKSMLYQPAEKMAAYWDGLPCTLLHGDTKIANMALMPDGSIAAFDWAFMGYGPCSIDIGWYIAVNATRLARSKEEVISTYRALLESKLQFRIDEITWLKIAELAILAGARMMLWSKALAYNAGTEKGVNEWNWWLQQLKVVAINAI